MPRLVFIGDQLGGRAVELREGKTRVGRGPWNGLIIPERTVSAYHCDIHVHGTEVIVREKASTNGTWVEGKRVTGQSEVKPGQFVRFGLVSAQLEFDGTESCGDDATDETAYHEYLRIRREQRAKACRSGSANRGAALPAGMFPTWEVPPTMVVQAAPSTSQPSASVQSEPERPLRRACGWMARLLMLFG